MPDAPTNPPFQLAVSVRAGRATLAGDLTLPSAPSGIVVFVHGSGSSRQSPRNQRVARSLVYAGFGTLLFDLLTGAEEAAERFTRHLRFDIRLLAERLTQALAWLGEQSEVRGLPIGLFGASTGAAAALIAAAQLPHVGAVVSRGGRPDLAREALVKVRCPTLLVVGGNDVEVIELNRRALQQMTAPTKLSIVPGATHLFEEPGALDEVTRLATGWFRQHLVGVRTEDQPRGSAL